jgi:UDP-glucose 4-epimerase
MADMRVLVSGGAGYIGSHTVLSLLEHGHEVVVVDDFSNSKPSVIGRLEELSGKHVPVHAFDLTDTDKTAQLFGTEQIDAVIHFAGLKAVGESVVKPLEYYATNLDSTFSLLRAMRQHGVRKLVFSSSATVYGDNAPVPYHEDYEPLSAASPYGRSKVMIEHVLSDVAAAEDLKVALLRYFNPVGAHPSGTIGEDPQGIPNNRRARLHPRAGPGRGSRGGPGAPRRHVRARPGLQPRWRDRHQRAGAVPGVRARGRARAALRGGRTPCG